MSSVLKYMMSEFQNPGLNRLGYQQRKGGGHQYRVHKLVVLVVHFEWYFVNALCAQLHTQGVYKIALEVALLKAYYYYFVFVFV